MDTTITLSTLINLFSGPALAMLFTAVLIMKFANLKTFNDAHPGVIYLVVSVVFSVIAQFLTYLGSTTNPPTAIASLQFVSAMTSTLFVFGNGWDWFLKRSTIAHRLTAIHG